jgi:hypothetical protein
MCECVGTAPRAHCPTVVPNAPRRGLFSLVGQLANRRPPGATWANVRKTGAEGAPFFVGSVWLGAAECSAWPARQAAGRVAMLFASNKLLAGILVM